ncbi:metallophosphoesterase [Haloquadratum walsbyi]|uniref:metallophosphoesterase n=1 Tax=Haloquadratum walsbyi TaxID=293091 RepID=UPI0023F4A99B|nr:metallophosphoesterase [Haloquadratum walsbyi]
MSRYVISDHHFGRSQIIEHTNRTFDSTTEMNRVLLNRHYQTVTESDTVIHLGDVAMDARNGSETIAFFNHLNGDILIRGDHDTSLDASDASFPVVQSCVLEHGNRRFYCTHRPENIPPDWDEWAIHGYVHDNPEEFPFIMYDDRRINVSSELLEYRPITLERLGTILNDCSPGSRFCDITAVRSKFG